MSVFFGDFSLSAIIPKMWALDSDNLGEFILFGLCFSVMGPGLKILLRIILSLTDSILSNLCVFFGLLRVALLFLDLTKTASLARFSVRSVPWLDWLVRPYSLSWRLLFYFSWLFLPDKEFSSVANELKSPASWVWRNSSTVISDWVSVDWRTLMEAEDDV